MDILTALEALKKTPFGFLRHGETDWNRGTFAQGQTDVPINDAGRQQAGLAAKILSGHQFTRIVTSPLSRARDTAVIVNSVLNLPIDEGPGLMERSFGPYEGKPWNPAWIDGEPGPGAEPLSEFRERILTTLVQLLERPGPLLLVSHGGVFKVLTDLLCALPEARAPNALPFRFDPPAESGDTRWRLTPLDPMLPAGAS